LDRVRLAGFKVGKDREKSDELWLDTPPVYLFEFLHYDPSSIGSSVF